jgi:oxygen-independent coproporphyrinogen-3 oxidase
MENRQDECRMTHGVYIHIPFCEQRCYYCAFTVATTPESTYGPYVDRLIQEIRISGFSEHPRSIYLGGGTPSIISADLLSRILDLFPGPPREVSIEVNPGTVSAEKLRQYRDGGINRISLGAQSLEDEDLERAGRIHRSNAVYDDFNLMRRLGFDNISIDLIAGLPQQRLEVWRRNLDGVVQLRPDHVSIYMLDQEERSAWGKHIPSDTADDNFVIFYEEAASRLDSAGYRQYEISSWAVPGAECQHNLGYWTGVPYRGFGVGAHSYDGTQRFWNTSSLPEYGERIDAGRLPVSGSEILSLQMRIEEAFLLGLRQTAGFDVRAAAKKLELEIPMQWTSRVHDLQQAGLVDFDGTVLKLTLRGRLLASSVTEELLWPSPQSTALSSTFEATP